MRLYNPYQIHNAVKCGVNDPPDIIVDHQIKWSLIYGAGSPSKLVDRGKISTVGFKVRSMVEIEEKIFVENGSEEVIGATLN